MTNVEALKALYKALGGDADDVANMSTNPELIAKIATKAGSGLPEVTAEDNGDVLTVVEGAWGKAKPSGRVVINATYNPSAITFGVQMKEIFAHCEAGEEVVVIASGSDGVMYFTPTFKSAAPSYLFQSYSYNGNSNAFQFRFFSITNTDSNTTAFNVKTVTPDA